MLADKVCFISVIYYFLTDQMQKQCNKQLVKHV